MNNKSFVSPASTKTACTTAFSLNLANLSNQATVEEIEQLEQILSNEKSHAKQWKKHLLAIITIVLSLVVNLLRGAKGEESFLEIEKCGLIDWSIFFAFVFVALCLSYVGIRTVRTEQSLKQKIGIGLAKSDIRFQGKKLFNLLFFAFVGGWVSGALGLGGGSIFNPLMISMGVPPSVSTSTGMYMIMYSTMASSVIFISYGALDLPFSIWLGFWTVLGIIVGLAVIK